MSIFIDASVFCAFANERDVHYKKAVKIIHDIIRTKYGKQVTTDYIFDELIAVITRRASRRIAKEFGTTLLNSEVFIAKVDSGIFQEAWEFFKNTENFNFTDCTTLAFMKTFEIKKIATFDKEFKKVKWTEVVDI